MLHPSYRELMQKVNENAESEDAPIVNSRYSIVLGTAKRARQIVAADAARTEDGFERKALSIAVEELNEGKIHIVSEQSDSYETYVPDENGAV